MSVTVTNEIKKAEVLASGLKSHLDEVKQIGVTAEGIKRMEELYQKSIQKKNAEQPSERTS